MLGSRGGGWPGAALSETLAAAIGIGELQDLAQYKGCFWPLSAGLTMQSTGQLGCNPWSAQMQLTGHMGAIVQASVRDAVSRSGRLVSSPHQTGRTQQHVVPKR